MFESVLIANRGEIAIRVARACAELGVRSVAVHSEVDADAPHVRACDDARLLGPAAPSESYLHVERVIAAALDAGVDAIHPGYGFLSENADFARAVLDAGLAFVGPSPEAIEAMGDKVSARRAAADAGVPVVPGTAEPVTDPEAALAFGAAHGYPIAVKAAFGGGGRGMKVVRTPDALPTALDSARREALGAFGRGECYLERYLERPRHVEIQVVGDLDGSAIHLGDRDCSLQRRHQKLVEEAPAPGIDPAVRAAMAEAAVRLTRHMGYAGAGTIEMLLDADGTTFYFLEMNTRLQVEHPVTELVTGIDLVHAQLRVAAGDGLGITQDDVVIRGHAIEARLNAEDPTGGTFLPAPGRIGALRLPAGPGVRVDTGVEPGYEIPRQYDSLVAKLIVWDGDREGARRRMRRALDELKVGGVATTAPFHRLAMVHEQFVAAEHSTRSVEAEWDLSELAADPDAEEEAQMPAHDRPSTATAREVELTIEGRSLWVTVHGRMGPDATASGSADGSRRRGSGGGGGRHDRDADGREVRAPMEGQLIDYAVAAGASVDAGDLVAVLEAMKMETHVLAHRDGVVVELTHAIGDVVDRGTVLALIDAGGERDG